MKSTRTERRDQGFSFLSRAGAITAGSLILLAIFAPLVNSAGRSEARRTPVARDRSTVQRDPAHLQDQLCAGGMELPITIDLIPDAVIAENGRERVEYHAEIEVQRGDDVGLAWEADVFDDRGRPVVSGISKGAAKAKKGELKSTAAISSPLPDGFSGVRIRAVASLVDEPTSLVEKIQYVHVLNGKWAELTDSQWHQQSKATLVHAINPSGGKVQ
jgi:hypothetical protein